MVRQTHKNTQIFKKSLLALAIAGITSQGYAQQESEATESEATEEELVEVIDVRGLRGNLMRASDLKREAGTFLDAIDASDISSLPDTSITEALQRVPGVAIERFAARNDPDHFSTEGTGVVIRGLSQTRSEFNGRSTFSANSGRGLGFSDVPPELVGSVLVYKNQMAEMVEGGLSGTINLVTRKPFDSPERVFAFNAEYAYGDLRGDTTPQFSFLYSDRTENDNGEFGLLVNYTKAKVNFRSDGIQSGVAWDNRSTVESLPEGDGRRNNALWLLGNVTDANGNEVLDADGNPVPQRIVRGAQARIKEDDRVREGGSVSLQWRSPNENTTVTAEYIRSDSSLEWQERAVDYDRNDDAVPVPVEGAPLIFDEDGYMLEGYLTAGAAYRSNVPGDDEFQRLQNTTNWGDGGNPDFWPRYGGLVSASTRFRRDENLVEDFSLNVKHQASDNLFLEFDAQRVNAEASTIDHSIFMGANTVVYYKDRGTDHAQVGFYDPFWTPDPGFESNLPLSSPNNAYWRAGMPAAQDNEGDETAFEFDAKYVMDSGFISSIKTGVRYAKRDQTTRESAYHWKHLKATWHDGGPGWVNSDTPEVAALNDYWEVYDFSELHKGAIIAGSQVIVPTMELVRNYGNPQYADALKALGAIASPDGYELLNERIDGEGNGTVNGGDYLAEEINTNTEKNTGFYVQANYSTEWGDVLIDGNFGLRYVRLENETDGFVIYPDYTEAEVQRRLAGGNVTREQIAFLFYPEDQRAFGSGQAVATTFSGDFSKVLPSFNLRAELKEDLFFRLGISQAVAYPTMGNRRAYLRLGEDDQVTRTALLDDNNEPILDDDGNPQQVIESANVIRFTASGGNPSLEPMESTNYDASLEWYFEEGANLIASVFYKDLENFFISGIRTEQIDSATGNNLQDVAISGATNGGDGTLKGLELSYQQFYGMLPEPFDGLGIQANWTHLKSDGVPNANLENGVSLDDNLIESLPLEQLSEDTINFVLMYEKYGWKARFAYNWRSDFLLTSRDVITRKPIFNENTGQLDGSVFYSVNDNIEVGIQAVNLLDETIHTTMLQGDRRLNRSWFVNDRRYSFIVRGRF